MQSSISLDPLQNAKAQFIYLGERVHRYRAPPIGWSLLRVIAGTGQNAGVVDGPDVQSWVVIQSGGTG